MTKLSVNINKVALLRNSRGGNNPDVVKFAAKCLDFGAQGITLHPRPDQRHARYQDVKDLNALVLKRGLELNVEGNPTPDFLKVVMEVRPAQCTLVPDSPDQLTSDHGWSLAQDGERLKPILRDLKALGIRSSLFMDVDSKDIPRARDIGADRIELYTEPYAKFYSTPEHNKVLSEYQKAAEQAQSIGLGVNAGHDLSLENFGEFLKIPGILEVSIGHALIAECLDLGLEKTIKAYIAIIENAKHPAG